MSAQSRERFADVVRAEPVDLATACLLIGAEVDAELTVDAGLARLDELAALVRPQVPPASMPLQAAEGLRDVLGRQEGFAGSQDDYAHLRSSLLHEVLRRRRGLPLTLSVVWVEVARRLGVQAEPVGLPGHVVVRIGGPDGFLVDPFAGGALLDTDSVAERVRAATGGPLRREHLDPTPPVDLLARLLNNVRALTARQERSLGAAATRLWAVELSLLLPSHPVALRRERGELMVRLGDHLGGARALEAYAELVDGSDDEGASQARAEARTARARLN